MTLKVAILDTNALENKGSYGRLVGLLTALNIALPKHDVTVFHRYYDVAEKGRIEELKRYHPSVDIKRHPWYNEKSHIITTTAAFMASSFVFALKQLFYRVRSKHTDLSVFDVIIDLNLIEPDKFNDRKIDLINVFGQFFALLSVWNATIANGKVVVCSATVGPFSNPLVRYLAERILNKVSLITLREDFSRDYLESINVKRPEIEVTADLAFLMEVDNSIDCSKASRTFNVDTGNNAIVGICPAAMTNSILPEDEYIRLLSEVSDFLIDHFGATILFIANTYQDVGLVENINQIVNNPENTRIVPFSASATEVKSVIGICDLFICSRFHALVASTSMGVPSIGLVSYSNNKFHGIVGKMMGQEEYLMDVDQTFDYEIFLRELKLRSEKILQDGESVRVKLLEYGASTKKRALVNGYLIRDLALRKENIAGD